VTVAGPPSPGVDGRSQIHVQTIPSSDRAFAEHVSRVMRREGLTDPDVLQDRLIRLFPRVVVRSRDISGERPAWYVYRDGRWSPPDAAPWWTAPNVARLTADRGGWLVDADPGARSLLGLGDLVADPRHYTDLIAPGAVEDAGALFEIIDAGHALDATLRLRPSAGGIIACDVHAVREGDRLIASIRLADDIPWQDLPSTPPISITTEPASDAGFRDYVDLLLARMPEPSVDGLSLRLHRLYPHARVEAVDGRWLASRDEAGTVGPPDGWWGDPGLATVRYDDAALIVEANAAAVALLGNELVGHHWQEFVTPGGAGRVDEFLPIIRREGVVVSRFRMPGADGALLEFDSYSDVDGDLFRTVMRPLD